MAKKQEKKAPPKKQSEGFNPENVHRIARLSRAEKSEIRIVINEFEDRAMIDLRQWYKKAGDDEFKPGQGKSFDVALIPALRKALKKAERIAREEGLLDDED